MEDDQFELEWTEERDWGDPMLCRSLWLSVIAQALVDANSKSMKPANRKAKAEATAWFAQSGGSSDFEQVCDLAGVNAANVRKVFKRVRHGGKSVDFRCLRKPKLINRAFMQELEVLEQNGGGEHGSNWNRNSNGYFDQGRRGEGHDLGKPGRRDGARDN